MKKILKVVLPCLVAALILVSSVFAVPSFAAEPLDLGEPFSYGPGMADIIDGDTYTTVTDCTYKGTVWCAFTYFFPAGYYVVYGNPVTDSTERDYVQALFFDEVTEEYNVFANFGDVVYLDPAISAEWGIFAQSLDSFPTLIPVDPPSTGLFNTAYSMFAEFIYGSSENLTNDQTLVLTILGTVVALAVVLLPFVIVWMVLCFISGRR